MSRKHHQSIRGGATKNSRLFLHRLLCTLLASLQLLLPSLAAALPGDGTVVGGSATIQQANPKTLNIQQTTDKAILNWKSFSIAADEAVHFVQPSASSIALNRVVGTDPSVILGRLQSNGRLFLLNPNGILFGAGAQVNVGGLLATTLQIRDEDFMAGRYLFTQDPLKSLRTVINQGTIQVSDHGFAFLVAPGVANEGVIVANLGTVVLGSGRTLAVDLMGDGLIHYALSGKVLDHVTGIDGKPLGSAVSNSGTIQADGGRVILQAKAAGDIFSSVVNQSGVVRARSLAHHGGVVKLIGGGETLVAATDAGAMRPAGEVSGAVVNSGSIDVSAAETNASQGSVTLLGERVGQYGSIAATGAEGANGGDVVITSTTRTLLADGSTINVSGSGHSSGGRLRVWSDQDTFFNAGSTILARGGNLEGNGGFVEISGKENLGFAGSVNALAPFGHAGTLLLDPRNITIAAAGAAYNPGVNNLFANTPAANVTISAGSMNAAAANVVLQANNDITVGSAINMANAGVGITMQAGRDIAVNAPITTNNGNISLTANDAAAIAANRLTGTGDIVFGVGANLNAGNGSIALNIGPTAGVFSAGSIANVRNLTTTTGNITLNSRNTISLSGAVNAGSGTVSINANTDGAGAQGFTMNAGSSIATTNAPVTITVNSPTGGTGAATLRNIATGSGSFTTVTNPGVNTVGGGITQVAGTSITAGGGGQLTTGNGNISLRNITTNSDLLIASRNVVALNGTVNAGAGTVSINANTDGAGAQGFTMNAGSSIATTNSGANAVQIVVNSPTGGTGAASLRGSISTGNGGTATVSTRGQAAAGGNTTGGAIAQSAALAMNTGAAGTVALATGAAASSITLNTAGNDFTGAVGVSRAFNVTLRDANALTLGASTISGTLGVTTAGAVTQSGPLTVTGITTVAAGAANNITLNNPGNNFSTVGVTSGNNVALMDTNALVLGASTVSGALNVATNGALTQSGILNVTGATTLTAGVGNNINLATSANNFSTVGVISGNNVSLRDTNALNLGASTVSGNLALTIGGALTQSGALNVAGTTSFTASVANTDILLGSQANNFGGALTFAGTLSRFRDVSIRNVNAGAAVPTLNTLTSMRNLSLQFDNAPVTLPAATLTAGGNLTVTAGGAITDIGNLVVPGTTTLTAGANNITLNNANNFTGAVSVTSGNVVVLNDINALALGPSTISGALNVTTAGAVTQTGPLTVTGTTTLTAGAANSIALNNAANDFGTVGVTSGNNVALTDINSLILGASTVSGTLGVTSGGVLTQSGVLNVSGTTTFTATAANTDILLGTQPNNFAGPLSFAGTLGNFRDVSLRNVNAGATVPALAGLTSLRNLTLAFDNAPLVLPTLTVSGNLTATAGGLISQSGALTVAGTAGFDTTAAATLGSVTLTNGNALTLNTSTVGGNLTVTTTAGDLTLPAGQTLTVVGDATLTPSGTVNLLGTTRIGGTQASVGGTGATFVLGADTNLNALPLPGTGSITVNTTGTTATFAGPPVLPQAINLGNAGNTFGGPVSVTTAAPAFTGTTTNTYNLTQSAPVNLNVGQGLTVTDLGGTAGTRGNITLTNAGNSFETVNFTGGNIAWTETGPVTINTVSANAGTTSTGTLSITATGLITQTGAITAAGTTTLAAGAAGDIILTNAGNSFGTVGVTSGNNVALADADALDLAASTVGGTLNVTTNGALTQSGALTVTGTTTLTAGAANSIALNNAANDFGTVGVTSGNNIALTDANALTLNASTVSGSFTAIAADLTVGGSLASTGGNLNLTGANTVTQLAGLTAAGTNSVAVTTSTGGITMAAAATTASGTGAINYTSGTDVTLGSLSTGGGVNVVANGGSVLSAAGSGTNVTAGANATLQALNGVVGTPAAPLTVDVNPGTLSIRATTAVSGISAFLTGTVLPGNALTLLNVPPGLVCFNGCPVPASPLSGIGSPVNLNLDSVIPGYYRKQSATYDASPRIMGDGVAREVGPCHPQASCHPPATSLTVVVEDVPAQLSSN